MPSLGALDVPYGSQVQIVRTTYALIAATNPAETPAKNLLELLQNEFNGSLLRPDYLIVDGGSDFTESDPNILSADDLTHATNLKVPLLGPMPHAVGAGSTDSWATDLAATGTKANGEILAILSVGATTATFGTPTAGAATTPTFANIVLDPDGADSVEAHLMSSLMTEAAGGASALIQLGGANNLAVDLGAAAAASSGAIDLSDADLNASYVSPGNAAGTTRTFTGDALASSDKVAFLTVVALVKAA